MSSVTALDLRYKRKLASVTEAGAIWSWPPAISSSGARWSLWKSTAVGAWGLKLARLAWNSTWSGPGAA